MIKYSLYPIMLLFITILLGCDGVVFSKYWNMPDLGNGYKFDTGDGNSLAITNSENTVVVGAEILTYAFDSTYIIIAQRPWNVPNVPGINEMTSKQRDKAFAKSKFCQYWIINKKEKDTVVLDSLGYSIGFSNVYGPYDKHTFLEKREELGVPRDLQLKEW